MEKQLLDKIKNELPAGCRAEIAKRSGTSKGTVQNFLDGKTINLKVIKATHEVYAEYKEAMQGMAALANA